MSDKVPVEYLPKLVSLINIFLALVRYLFKNEPNSNLTGVYKPVMLREHSSLGGKARNSRLAIYSGAWEKRRGEGRKAGSLATRILRETRERGVIDRRGVS